MGRTFIFFLAGAISCLGLAACTTGMPAEPPLASARTINGVLDAHPNDDVQMVLVHGMRTADRTTWDDFRKEVCGHLRAPHRCASAVLPTRVTDRLDLGPRPTKAVYLADQIWKSDDAWHGSQPFIDHYAFTLENGHRLVLHEVNWWPLVFALKCQFAVPNDTELVGPNKDNINNCARNPDKLHFGWLADDKVKELLAWKPVSGGAPHLNGGIKTDILDWGLSDAVLSLGTMKTLLRETIRCSFEDILTPRDTVTRDAAGIGSFPCDSDQHPATALTPGTDNFIIASHSLGAFLLLDTFAAAAGDAHAYDKASPCGVVASRSSKPLAAPQEPETTARRNARFGRSLCLAVQASGNLYFLANQFSLIELGRAQGIEEPQATTQSTPPSFTDALTLWSDSGPTRQIVAFSDPGDVLTFKLPQVGTATIYNAYPKNDTRWFGQFENPETAHLGYFTNKDVLQAMFGP